MALSSRLERADAALADDHVGVALTHDVLGCHEQLVDGAGDAALEKNRRLCLANLLEQREVLCVARTDLPDLDVAGEELVDVSRVHYLGHDGHVELVSGRAQDVEALLAHALVGVGGGAGLIGATAEHRGAGSLDLAGDADEVVALDRAGAGDDVERAAAHFHAMPAVHDRVERVELAVGALEGLGDALDSLDDVHALDEVGVNLGRVAHEADDRGVVTLRDVGGQALALDPAHEMVYLLRRCRVLDDCDHRFPLVAQLGLGASYS